MELCILKSKGPCVLLNKNRNSDKNETESKIENPKHTFTETNIVMSWSSQKKTEGIFCIIYFGSRDLFLRFVFYINVKFIEYTLLLVSKIIESLQCILNIGLERLSCKSMKSKGQLVSKVRTKNRDLKQGYFVDYLSKIRLSSRVSKHP